MVSEGWLNISSEPASLADKEPYDSHSLAPVVGDEREDNFQVRTRVGPIKNYGVAEIASAFLESHVP